MAVELYNLVGFSTATTGTGTMTVGSALTGCQTPASAGVPNATVLPYTIRDGSAWEFGYGTYTVSGTTWARTSVLGSSNSGSAINLSGSAQVRVTPLAQTIGPFDSVSSTFINGSLAATVASSALTIAVKTAAGSDPSLSDPVYVLFRNATIGTGSITALKITAATSLVISSGSTMGTTANIAFRLWVVGFNDAGTFRLGAVNCRSSLNVMSLRSDLLKSATSEGGAGAADSAQVIYSNATVTTKAMAVLGFLDWGSGLGTAGTWSAVPTTIQIYGEGVSLPGDTVQVARNELGSTSTSTTVLPDDGTTPQITEGVEFLTQAITPTAAANLLATRVQGVFGSSILTNVCMVLFNTTYATTDGLAGTLATSPGTNDSVTLYLDHTRLAATTSATTFRMRAGPRAAATVRINGYSSGSVFGGIENSFIEVREIMG